MVRFSAHQYRDFQSELSHATLAQGVGCGLDACEQLAEAYEVGFGVTPDPARAAALLERACDEQPDRYYNHQACNKLGEYLAAGKVVAKDEARAARLFGRGCDPLPVSWTPPKAR